MVGVAVKVTLPPEQTGFAEARMETLTAKRGFTVMVTVLEVAGLPVAQEAFEVSLQVGVSGRNSQHHVMCCQEFRPDRKKEKSDGITWQINIW